MGVNPLFIFLIDGCISQSYTLFEISAKEIGLIRDLDFDGQHMQPMAQQHKKRI